MQQYIRPDIKELSKSRRASRVCNISIVKTVDTQARLLRWIHDSVNKLIDASLNGGMNETMIEGVNA